MGIKAFISGCSGLKLTPDEVSFFRQEKPWGLILFARNCETPEQITALIDSFRQAVSNPQSPVLIDQEGGRVQRLKPPQWQQYCPSIQFEQLFQQDHKKARRASWLQARLIAHDLHSLGINVDCLPVLDVPQTDADLIIGDRAYGSEPEVIAELAKDAISGLMSGGVLPVMKHIPGHGRALCDSHLDLPVVDMCLENLRKIDFAPFKALCDTPLAMTAHIVYSQIDKTNPATHSSHLISQIIRGEIGFDGALMSDDLSMNALKGSLTERTRKTFSAGCDLALHCNGVFEEMCEVAKNSPPLEGDALRRTNVALSLLKTPDPLDEKSARAELTSLLAPLSP